MTTTPDTLIYGLGRSGRGTLRFLVRHRRQAHWWDARPSSEDLALAEEAGFARGDPRGTYRVVIAAPGVPIDHPDLIVLRERGAEIIGEAELAYRSCPTPIVGVTGTAGKGGTSFLITQMLTHLGVRARLGGNFDPPLLDVVEHAEVAVAELSSFQLERVQSFRPVVAVITNLGVDHLDRHGSVAAYHAAKHNITRMQTPADTLILPWSVDVATRARVLRFGDDAVCLSDGQMVMPLAEVPEGHHPANVAAAVLAVEAYLHRVERPVNATELRAAVLAARPVPGRFETVARAGELRFVEDSIATRTLAVKAALERAQEPVAWLVGGRDKGADLHDLADAVARKVTHVVAFGEDGARFAAHFGKPTTHVPGADGNAVMRAAVRAAANALPGRGTVLLAPIGTSFDLFPDYKARGAAFAEAAREYVALQEERA